MAKLFTQLAINNRMGKSSVLRELIKQAPGILPRYMLTVLSYEPFILHGDKWEGVFTGVIRIKYPESPGGSVFYKLAADYAISMTFEEVVNRLKSDPNQD